MTHLRTTGVSVQEPDHVEGDYVLFAAPDGVTRLIDHHGDVVHRWEHPGVPSRIIDPALVDGELGRVGLQLSDLPSEDEPRGGIYPNRTVGELSWDGEVRWEWGTEAPGGAARQNHDWTLLDNGNRLYLVTVPRVVPFLGNHTVGDQGLYEVDASGQLVWQWLLGDHLDELGLSEEGLEDLRATSRRHADTPWGYAEINTASVIGPNRLHDGDPTSPFTPGNVIISSRKANVIAVVDRVNGSDAVLWRLGPSFDSAPGDHHERILQRRVPRPLDQISGQHNPHIIAEDLPGAGNLLIFDNQGGAGYPPVALGIYPGSRVLEVDPLTRQIVWQYTAEDSGRQPWEFFSAFVSNAQRLPNGNTLVTEGMHGRIFQVTPTGRIVWEYVSPYSGPAAPGSSTESFLVYRAQHVPAAWVPVG
ncbi:aryl-sulfate sulfotransferase [Corynebacterium sp. USCH3]|uniref:aryl-sulfate sulfotransferase n=1 Tax=Corynebacterium sp. USCH3 TaxID=3024840 RepID=UPI0030A671CC